MNTQRLDRIKEWYVNAQVNLFYMLIALLEETETREDA